jgi:hypothetical protein
VLYCFSFDGGTKLKGQCSHTKGIKNVVKLYGGQCVTVSGAYARNTRVESQSQARGIADRLLARIYLYVGARTTLAGNGRGSNVALRPDTVQYLYYSTPRVKFASDLCCSAVFAVWLNCQVCKYRDCLCG